MNRALTYRKDIQALRGLAVFSVILFHANENYFPLGYLGVDVFFVISGFVVTPLILRLFIDQTTLRERFSALVYFYKRRFYRLGPALALMLILSSVAVFLLGERSIHERFARQGIATILLVGNFGAYKFSGNYFSPSPNPLVHTWSLSVEEQIYIFLPFILIIILHKQLKIHKLVTSVFAIILAISFSSFISPSILNPLYSLAGVQLESQFSFYSPIDRIWQFTLGGLGYFLVSWRKSYNIKNFRILNFAFLSTFILVLFGSMKIEPKIGSIIASIATFIIILYKSLDALPKFLGQKFEWIGDRSYSIYLFHMPLIYIAKYSKITQIGNGHNRDIQSLIAIFASVILGALSFQKVEQRFRKKGMLTTFASKVAIAQCLLITVVPLALFVTMDFGQKKQYWGLDKSIERPQYAGDLDPNCSRDSEIGPPCSYLNPGAIKTVLLLGDSHAGHISQAVVDAAMNSHWNAVIWTHASCHVQFERSIKKQVSDTCLEINKKMKKWVIENKPNVIIISQYVHSDSSQYDLRSALVQLHSLVPNILLIENNPVFPDWQDFMVARAPILFPYEPPKNFKQSKMQTKDVIASSQLATWAKLNGMFTMNLNSLFCNGENCTRYAGSEWLYQDDNHLSVAGAKLTIPLLMKFLSRV
jgi:peptidoglycan/LPS O-acetylase OafA/YrhL